MRDDRLADLARRLVPLRVRQDGFDPSLRDLRIARAAAGRRHLAVISLLLLVADCWRLALDAG